MINAEINKLAEEALAINRTFGGDVWPKQAMQPVGFLPPNKREKIVSILKRIAELSENQGVA